jgi:hypothetical protein
MRSLRRSTPWRGDVLGGREHGVALSDIDLVTQTRASKVGIEPGTDPQDRKV